MKLAIISGTTLPGGGPRHIYSLLEKMDRKEWDIMVCTHKDGSYWDKLIALGITPYDLVLRRLAFLTFFELFKILRKEKPDLIGLNVLFSGNFPDVLKFTQVIREKYPKIKIAVFSIMAVLSFWLVFFKLKIIGFIV